MLAEDTVSRKKTGHLMLHRNFGKSEPIYKKSFTKRFLRKPAMYIKDSHLIWNI